MAYGVRVRAASQPPRSQALATEYPPLPPSFQHYRRELGAQVYGAMGIGREDTAKHAAAVLRNWEFFRAPLAG